MLEIVVIVSVVCSSLLVGFMSGLIVELRSAKAALHKQTELSQNQVDNFNDILKKASSSNESLGLLCKDLQTQIQVIDEKIAMVGGTTTTKPRTSWAHS